MTGVLLAATTWLAPPLAALDAERTLGQYLRTRWSSESGFPGGPVHAIAQTADGYLWIGAEKGLVRFDGLTFQLVDPRAGTGAGAAVLGVTAPADGSLWARLRGVGLVRSHDGRLDHLGAAPGAPRSVVTAMGLTREGAALFATIAHGTQTHRDGRFASVIAAGVLPSSSFVVALADTGDGSLWLGTRDAGLLRVSGTRAVRYTEGLPDSKINCLLASPDGSVWIGTDRGMARWSGAAITQDGVPMALRRVAVLSLTRDRDGNLWVAAGTQGLLRLAADGSVQSATDAGWSGGHVAATFEDRDGNLWIGTDRGLERWRAPMFTTYTPAHGLPADPSGPIHADSDGRVWFGPATGGLYWLRDGRVSAVTAPGLRGDVVYSIHGEGTEIWVGWQRGGLMRLRVGSDEAIAIDRITQRDGLAQDSVFAVHRTRSGATWAGTLSAGATLVTQGRLVTYDTRSGLPSNTVASLLEARDGTMWFGTPNGVAARSPGGWRTFTTADGLPSNDIITLFEDRRGTLWVGTTKGLAVIRAGKALVVDGNDRALRGPILGLAEDGRGWLWMHAADEILRVRRQALLDNAVLPGDVRRLGIADGLPGLDAIKRHRVLTQDDKGRIWMALTGGLSMTDPARADGRTLPSATQIAQLTADGVSVPTDGPIRLAPSRRIALGYAGLSLSVPERVRFRYRLDGFDRDWNEPTAERQVVFTNLPPGSYRFRLVASNSDGAWNGAESTLSFEIEPWFWQTVWFQLTSMTAAGLAGWGLYRLRVRQVARRLTARFEERLAERTRIAQELHDTLLQGFLSASMQLHVAVEALPRDVPARQSLERVHHLMRRVIDEGRHAVIGLRAPGTTSPDLALAFAGVQQEFGSAGPAYRVVVEGRPRALEPMVRDEVYRIGREALVNAFRHADATQVELEIEYGPRNLSLLVRDDGRGIDPGSLRDGTDGHFGIVGMRERAGRIGGTFRIRSRPGAGTEVELRVPGPLAFERRSSRWFPWKVTGRRPSGIPAPRRGETEEQS
ncbi:histidine kinase [Luteitalea sp. TBR-22]|uniref:sensor histidine kinase n=1 Tax=Luteitalea sp. TBR-22 TaxID=2802971 RepID=UPI001AF14290|nr:sensor histidine kinase [Luteitalea sp. TBR-22]BCS31701.1 histidine kinase [Luteitalea sp. TBR-22]